MEGAKVQGVLRDSEPIINFKIVKMITANIPIKYEQRWIILFFKLGFERFLPYCPSEANFSVKINGSLCQWYEGFVS